MHDQIAVGTPEVDPHSALGHRMRGNAIHGGYFDVPLINEVVVPDRKPWPGELWQGGCIGGLRLPDDFDYVFSLYPWEAYRLGPNTERREYKLYDSIGQATDGIEQIADAVEHALRQGKKVLVHCQAGLNRSGLLAGTVLKRFHVTGPDAVTILRQSRGTDQVLCNSTFETYVRDAA